FVFTNHLAAVDARWKNGPGVGKSVPWPVGIGGRGNSGVSALVRQTPGAIGYIETGYAELTKLPTAALENKSGKYIAPPGESAQAGLAEAKLNAVLQGTVPDPQSASAYPIASFTWVIFPDSFRDSRVAGKLSDLLRYCLTDGQKLSKELGYVPLPADTAKRALQMVDRLEAGSPQAMVSARRRELVP